ncbi:60 kDa chaperonin [Acrasis kona]|uniref:60 kDa chaperonin n=1 Tax=Acrasis kona TaxID=1008807 RepID=A0AAW2YLY4_9EUKA
MTISFENDNPQHTQSRNISSSSIMGASPGSVEGVGRQFVKGGLKEEDLQELWMKDEERLSIKLCTLKKRIQAIPKLIIEYERRGDEKSAEEKKKQLGAQIQEFKKTKGKVEGLKERLGVETKITSPKLTMRVMSPRQLEMKHRTECILQLKNVESLKK